MCKIKIPKFNNVIAAILSLLIIYMTGSVPTSIENGSSIARQISLVIIVVSLYPMLEVIKKKKWNIYLVVCCAILGMYGLFNYIHYAGSIKNLLVRFIWIISFFSAAIWFGKYKKISIEKNIYRIIILLSIISLMFWTVLYIFDIELPYSVIAVRNFTYNNYFDIFYSCSLYQMNFIGISIYRLQSIFWEPGVFGVLLNYALFYYVFDEKEKRLLPLIIIIICTLLTFSTTSIIVAICLLGYFFLNNKKIKKFKLLLFIPVVIIVAYGVISVWMEKKAGTNHSMMSYSLRMNDLLTGIELFLKNFFVGIGYDNIEVFKAYQGYGRGNSNGLITLCYSMGIVGLLLFIYPFFKNLKKEKGSLKIRQIVYIILFIVINMTEPIYSSALILWMVSSEYVKSIGR